MAEAQPEPAGAPPPSGSRSTGGSAGGAGGDAPPEAGSPDRGGQDRAILLAAVIATLVVCLAGAYLLGQSVNSLSERVDRLSRNADGSPGRPGPLLDEKGLEKLAARIADAIAKKEAADPKTIGGLAKQISQLSEDCYQYYTDDSSDLHQISKLLKQVSNVLKGIAASRGQPGQAAPGFWGLPEPGKPPTVDTLARYRQEAEAAGVKVADGRVEVRGFLNMSPNRSMPIEYFVTRWPESGHETLVHVIGPTDVKDLSSERLKGLPTAIYKGLLAAGFVQGEGSHVEHGRTKDKPEWVSPTGDPVYLGVRYVLGGTTHVARATDWVGDPATGKVLPEDSFRFTGSRRVEDPDTGDQALSAEEGGLVVSVYFTPNTLVEIAVPTNVNDNYEYNYARIPKPRTVSVGDGALRFDLAHDAAAGTITLTAVDGGKAGKPDAPPDVVVPTNDGQKVLPTSPVAGRAGTWAVTAPELRARYVDWTIRAKAGGNTYEGGGYEVLYLDLIFSKTPIVVEGDGALPVQAIERPPPEPVAPPAPPAPPIRDDGMGDGMDDK